MQVRRQLGKLELAWGKNGGLGSRLVVGCYRFKGEPNYNSLKFAFETLQTTHPPLSCRVENRHNELFFTEKDASPIDIIHIKLKDELGVEDQFEQSLNQTIDWTEGPLFQVQIWNLEHSDEWVMCLLAHPAVIDSGSMHQIATQIFFLLNQDNLGSAEKQRTLSLPMLPSLDRMIPDEPFSFDAPFRMLRFAAKQIMSQFFLRPKLSFHNLKASDGAKTKGQNYCLRKRFSTSQLQNLERSSRAHGLHVTSALWAAFAMACYRMNHVHIASVAYQMMSPVSVRGFLEPPVPKHILGCYSSLVTFVESVGATTDFWSLAHHLKTRFDRAVLEGDALSFVSFATQIADVFSKRSTSSHFSMQLQDGEKWPLGALNALKKSHLQLVDSFESQPLGAFGSHCCLGLFYQPNGASLNFVSHSEVINRNHGQSILDFVCEILEAQTGVKIHSERAGANAHARNATEPVQPEAETMKSKSAKKKRTGVEAKI